MSNVSPTAFFRLKPKLLEATIVMVNTIMQASEEIILHYLCLSKEAIFILSVIDHFRAVRLFVMLLQELTFMYSFMMSSDLNVQVSIRTEFVQ